MTKPKANLLRKPKRYSIVGRYATQIRDWSTVIAKNISAIRRGRNLTQDQLAAISGVPQSVISYIESGWSNTRLSNLVALAEELGVNLYDVFSPFDYSIQNLNRGDVMIENLKIEYDTGIERNVPEKGSAIVQVKKGEAIVKLGFRERSRLLGAGDTVVVPGGDFVTIIGFTKDTEVTLVRVKQNAATVFRI